MNIVMVDSGELGEDPPFPGVNLPKFSWLQFVSLLDSEIDERCWRADVIISTKTPIKADVIKDSYKLRLIISAGENSDHIDKEAAKEHGVVICNAPGLFAENPQDIKKICNQVVANIDAWIDKTPINIID